MTSIRGYIRWRGQSAVYTVGEREIMAALPAREQAIVHTLKAFTDGEIQESAVIPSDKRLPAAVTGVSLEHLPSADYSTNRLIDPEDIPFGDKPKRRPKIYAVAWSWRKHKIHKTKKRCEQRLRVWKAWKERQGWTVMKFASGYLAIAPQLGETREVIQLHEYDRETKERLP